VPADQLAASAAALRPTAGSDTVVHATKLAIATLGRRVLALDADSKRLDDALDKTACESCQNWTAPAISKRACGTSAEPT
jgi:hypothetical protein